MHHSAMKEWNRVKQEVGQDTCSGGLPKMAWAWICAEVACELSSGFKNGPNHGLVQKAEIAKQREHQEMSPIFEFVCSWL